jgi:hypothetical protein
MSNNMSALCATRAIMLMLFYEYEIHIRARHTYAQDSREGKIDISWKSIFSTNSSQNYKLAKRTGCPLPLPRISY